MKKEDIDFLGKLTDFLEEAEARMEEAYKTGNFVDFNKAKRIMSKIQEKISEIIK